MQFQAVVGNPPYQVPKDNTSDNPIYHLFMDIAFNLSTKACLIAPARFLYNAGKTPKSWNRKMLSDESLIIASYEKESKNIFPGTAINGGIVVTYRDSEKRHKPITHFYPNNETSTIISKVLDDNSFRSMKNYIYIQNKFNLVQLYKDYPTYKDKISSNGNEKRIVSSAFDNLTEVFKQKKCKGDYVQICGLSGGKRIYKYIHTKYLNDDSNINFYKIMLSAADGASGTIGNPVPARIIGKPTIAEPGTGYTQTFISIGAFNNIRQAENLYKYLMTKFARFMVGTMKATNGLKTDVWSNVPMQDFTDASDIDWSKSIPEIDKQLYKKYGLDKKEIEFIESMIKPYA